MYINSINIKKYKIFENLNINFQIPKDNENVVNVIAGINGTGKTTLLELLFRVFKVTNFENSENFELICNDTIKIDKKMVIRPFTETINGKDIHFDMKEQLAQAVEINEDEISRVISLPMVSTLPYNPINEIKLPFRIKDIVYEIDISNMLANAELFIKEYIINRERNSLESEPKKRTKEAVDNFNKIFENINLTTKLIDLDRHNKPIFETKNKKRVTIDKLSSGEQQLYARVVSLMIIEPINSIILIDEPEITLHPKWQNEIINIYKNIGKNNQFIITTHSPHIITSTKNEYLRLLKFNTETNQIEVVDSGLYAHGRDINSILFEVMGEVLYRPNEFREKIDNLYYEIDNKNFIEAQKLLDNLAIDYGKKDSIIMEAQMLIDMFNKE